jgi:hypothetical protein
VEYSVDDLMMLEIPVIAARHVCSKRMKAGFGENLKGGGGGSSSNGGGGGGDGGNCV